MKLYTTEGIVFKIVKYGETSIICEIFTKSKGLRSFIVNGVRSAKSKSKSSLFQYMNILELTTADHSSDKLSRLNEYSLSKVYQNIPFDVLRSSIGIFTLELSRNAIQEKESNEELFDFLYSWFTYLDVENVFYPLAHLKFMTELSKHLGFAPLENYNESRTIFDLLDGEFVDIESNKYHLNHELSHYLFQLLSVSFEDLKDLEIPKAIRKKLINVLLDYYALHLPTFKELKSHKVLEELLN